MAYLSSNRINYSSDSDDESYESDDESYESSGSYESDHSRNYGERKSVYILTTVRNYGKKELHPTVNQLVFGTLQKALDRSYYVWEARTSPQDLPSVMKKFKKSLNESYGDYDVYITHQTIY